MSKKKKTLLAFYAVVMLVIASVLVANPQPASAVTYPSLYHYSPDDGYDQPILVKCATTFSNVLVMEGDSIPAGCHGMSQIFVRDNEEIWCKYDLVWKKQFDTPGWRTMSNTGWSDGSGCTVRRD